MTEARAVTVTYTAQPDLSPTNASPVSNAVYRADGSITFTGTAENSPAQSITQGGYADVEIDWSSDGSFENLNAYSGNELGAFSPNDTKTLSYTYNSPPVGEHRYRFNVDTANTLIESDETNNRSAWTTFRVVSGDVSALPMTINYGGTTTVSWTSNGTAGLGCTVSGGGDSWNIDSVSSPQISSGLAADTVYALACGATLLDSVTVIVDTTPEIGVSDDDRTVEQGSYAVINWDTKGQDCTLTDVGLVGPGTGNETGSQSVLVLARTEYVLACPGGDVTETVEIIRTIFES
jgi:hypothetical protein